MLLERVPLYLASFATFWSMGIAINVLSANQDDFNNAELEFGMDWILTRESHEVEKVRFAKWPQWSHCWSLTYLAMLGYAWLRWGPGLQTEGLKRTILWVCLWLDAKLDDWNFMEFTDLPVGSSFKSRGGREVEAFRLLDLEGYPRCSPLPPSWWSDWSRAPASYP